MSFTLNSDTGKPLNGVDGASPMLFPNGYPIHFVNGRQMLTFPYYTKLDVKTMAAAEITSDTTIRFNFLPALRITSFESGQPVERVYPAVKFEFSREDVERIKKLQASRIDRFFLSEGQGPFGTIEQVLGNNNSSLEELAIASYDLQSVPALYVFENIITLVGEGGDKLQFSDFKTGTVKAKLSRALLKKVTGFDRAHSSIETGEEYLFPVRNLVNWRQIEATDPDVSTFLQIQARYLELRFKRLGLTFSLETNVKGQRQVIMKPSPSNVVPMNCELDLSYEQNRPERPFWHRLIHYFRPDAE